MKQEQLSFYIGVFDFNNMIPVRQDVVQKIQVRVDKGDSPATKRYKELLSDQLTFCRQNQAIIIKKANKLYQMAHQKNTSRQLKHRCLNWAKLESVLDRFHSK